MPIRVSGETYYRTSEASRMAGISRSTLLRWIQNGILKDVSLRDRRGWRLFTQADVKRIDAVASSVR